MWCFQQKRMHTQFLFYVPFRDVPINWSNIARIWSVAVIIVLISLVFTINEVAFCLKKLLRWKMKPKCLSTTFSLPTLFFTLYHQLHSIHADTSTLFFCICHYNVIEANMSFRIRVFSAFFKGKIFTDTTANLWVLNERRLWISYQIVLARTLIKLTSKF